MWTEENVAELEQWWTGTTMTQGAIARKIGKAQSSTAWKAHTEGMVRGSKQLITDLRPDQCKWETGPLLADPRFWCGAPREFPDIASNPYCARHRRMAVGKR